MRGAVPGSWIEKGLTAANTLLKGMYREYLLHYFMIWKAEEQIQSIWGRSLHVASLICSSFQDIFLKKIQQQQKTNKEGSLLRSLHLYLFSQEHRWQCSFLLWARLCPQRILWGMKGKQNEANKQQWCYSTVAFLMYVLVYSFHPCRFFRPSPHLPCEPCYWAPCTKTITYLRTSTAQIPPSV